MFFGAMLHVAAKAVARAAEAREEADVGRETLSAARAVADAGRKGASAFSPPVGRMAVATAVVGKVAVEMVVEMEAGATVAAMVVAAMAVEATVELMFGLVELE